jgi:hypothetical protein
MPTQLYGDDEGESGPKCADLSEVGNTTSAEALRHHSHGFWLHVAQRRLLQLRIPFVRNSYYVQKQLAEIYGAQVVVQRNYGRA